MSTGVTAPSPTPSQKKQNGMKKALGALKRRGSKLLLRRASTSAAVTSTTSTALISPSRSPSGSLRSRSPSPSPRPAVHHRARTTSFGFSLRGLRKNSGGADPSRSPNVLRKPSSLRSLRSDATTAVDSLTASSDGHASPLIFKDSFNNKLSLDMSAPVEGLPTIYSAVDGAPNPFLVDEEVATPEAITEEPIAEEPIAEEPVAEEPTVEALVAEAPSSTPAVAEVSLEPEATQELVVSPTPVLATPTPAPVSLSASPSPSEEEVYPEMPALVLPTLLFPIPPVSSLVSTVMGAPFFTLHWWLHPLLPLV